MTIINYKKMKKTLSIIIFLIFSVANNFATTKDSIDYPVVGKPCPIFTLTNVEYFKKTTLTNEDLKGKWFMLDFWGEYCIGCIKSFPKLNEIQKELGDKFQTVLIGVPYKKGPDNIRKLYERHREKLALKIPIVYESKLAEQFQASSFPHQVIVDPGGIVRYITSAVNKEEVKMIINNENPKLYVKFNAAESLPYDAYDTETPMLLYNNGGEESTYYLRTIFTEATSSMRPGTFLKHEDKVEIISFPLSMFYKFAFTGELSWTHPTDSLYNKFWPHPILEISDSTLFIPNYGTMDNFFSFSGSITNHYVTRFGKRRIDFATLLKKELETIFPFKATVENRKMICNVLYISPDKLKMIESNGSNSLQFKDGQFSGFTAKAIKISDLIGHLVIGSGYPKPKIPLLYEGKDLTIDINLESVYYDDRIKELNKLGFAIRQEEREMSVIIIRDNKM